MLQRDVRYNATIFPKPRKFDADRGLKGDELWRLERYLISFSKWTKMCIRVK